MRGLLARAREAAAPRAAAQACVGCGTGGGSQLEVALRRVTHSDCAAIPPETLREAARLAAESEEALAVALRHIEENAAAPPQEWRRIHGALALLERLIRPQPGAGCGGGGIECLVGGLWFEAKMQERLKALERFEHSGDTRVAVLIRRSAAAAQAAAERYVLTDCEAEDYLSGIGAGPSGRRACLVDVEGGLAGRGAAAAEGDGEAQPLRAPASPRDPQPRTANPQDGSKVQPTVIGRGSGLKAEAAVTSKLRNTAAALEALNDPSTRSPQRHPKAGGQPDPAGPPARRCCLWCLRRAATAEAQSPQVGHVDTDNSECETNTLLTDRQGQQQV